MRSDHVVPENIFIWIKKDCDFPNSLPLIKFDNINVHLAPFPRFKYCSVLPTVICSSINHWLFFYPSTQHWSSILLRAAHWQRWDLLALEMRDLQLNSPPASHWASPCGRCPSPSLSFPCTPAGKDNLAQTHTASFEDLKSVLWLPEECRTTAGSFCISSACFVLMS